jgi:hypothetical protein
MKRPVVALVGVVCLAALGCIASVEMASGQQPAGMTNLALRKPAVQSSTGYGGDAGRAVDGNTDGSYFGANSVSHTNNGPNEWWQVDLGASYPIQVVRIWNRTDCCAERLSRFHVFVSDTPLPAGNVQASQHHPGVWSAFFDRTAGRTTDIPVNRNGRYVRIQLAGADYLQLAEVEVFGWGATGTPPPTPPACDVAGTWRHGSGGETWTFTAQGGGRYAAQERGYGNASGPAVLAGNRLRIDYRTQDGRVTGSYEFAISADCARGDGRWQDSRPAGGSASMVRVSPAPTGGGGITWDFETGDLRGWTKTGTAFDFQPTYGDNPTARNRGQASQHQGNYWIGGYEKRPRQSDPPGQVQGDEPQGTLTSQPFTIQRPAITFLIGGGCDINVVRAELLVGGQVVHRATGKCTETMERTRWDVSRYVGQSAQIRLIDQSGAGWGHINFDDVRFE